MIKSFDVPSSNKLNELHLSARSYMKFSNNISSINVVSTLQDSQINKSLLTRFTVGSNIKAIQPSCFINCSNLAEVQFKGLVDLIGDYAFYNCSSLSKSNIFEAGQISPNIGDYAFAGCGIKRLKFGAKNQTSQNAYIGSSMFAECLELTSVSFQNDTILADSMFAKCSALVDVSFAKTTSRIEPNAFEDCTSLQRLIMPSDIYAVPDKFAKGCTSMTSLQFNEPGDLSYDASFGNSILSGTSITSLTFPSSVTDFNVFSYNTLNGMDDLKEIHFNGMKYNQLVNSTTVVKQEQSDQSQEVTIKYDTHKIYYSSALEKTLNWAGIDKSMYVQKSRQGILDIMDYCYKSNIPMAAFVMGSDFNNYGSPSCGNCITFLKKNSQTSTFIDFVKKNTKCVLMYITGDDGTTTHKFGNYQNFFYLTGMTKTNDGYWKNATYVMLLQCWKMKDSTLRRYHDDRIQGSGNAAAVKNNIISKVNDLTNGFNGSSGSRGSSVVVVNVNTLLKQTNCFGLNHDVRIFSNDGKYVDFKAGSGSSAIIYQQNVQVDRITTDYFKYGQWYSNAKQLKQYADANYIPVLAIAVQSSGYKNSIAFNDNVFNDPDFQEYMQAKPMLLCIVDTTQSSQDSSFMLSQWMKRSSFQNLPLLMMYWIKKNGSIVIPDIDSNDSPKTFDNLFDDFAYFSINQDDDQIDDVQCVHSTSDIINWINGLDVYKTYQSQPQFMKPEISSYMSSYPKYKKYENQLNDDYGQYFPVMSQSPASKSSYEVSVANSSGKLTKYTLKYSTDENALPPPATYQYFSLLSDNMTLETYESIYQVSGLIFKVGNTEQQMEIRNDFFNYEAKSETAYLNEIGVSNADILNVQSSFIDDIYLEDDDGDPTTEIDQDAASNAGFLFNVEKIISLKPGKKIDSEDADQIVMLLSSQASVQTVYEEDDEGDIDEFKTLVPGNPQYAINCKVLGKSKSPAQLLWMKEFDNGTNNIDIQNYSPGSSGSIIVPGDNSNSQDGSNSELLNNFPANGVEITGDAWYAGNDDVYSESRYVNDIMSKFIRSKRAPFGDPICLGQWNGYLEQCSAVAIQYEMPMIAVWSNYNCGYCEKLESTLLNNQDVNSFLNSSSIILAFTTSLDMHGSSSGQYNNSLYQNFCDKTYQGSGTHYFPFVRFFWYKNNGKTKVVDFAVSSYKSGMCKNSDAGSQVINYIRQNSGFTGHFPN